MAAMNDRGFRGSFKEAYGGRNMSLPVTVRLSEGVNGGYSEKKVNDTDTEDEDVGSVVDMR